MRSIARAFVTATGLLALACGIGTDVGTVRSAGAAYTNLYEALGRPSSLRVDGDTAVTIIRMQGRRATAADRTAAARGDARTVARAWPTGRLRRVTVVFRQATRLGPFVIGTRDRVVTVDDETPATLVGAP